MAEEFDLNKLVSLDGKLMTYCGEMLRQVNSNTEDWIARLGIDMPGDTRLRYYLVK